MAESKSDQRVAAVRRFNRFYTRQIGLLHEGYLGQRVLPDRGARALRARAPGQPSPRARWGASSGSTRAI